MTRFLTFLIFFVGINAGINAQESSGPGIEDRQLIYKTTEDYNICIQQNALQQMDNYDDIREVAAHAVDLCEYQLDKFKANFAGKPNAEFYSGLERTIKNRSIRKLLPLLMYEKSSRQTAETIN